MQARVLLLLYFIHILFIHINTLTTVYEEGVETTLATYLPYQNLDMLHQWLSFFVLTPYYTSRGGYFYMSVL